MCFWPTIMRPMYQVSDDSGYIGLLNYVIKGKLLRYTLSGMVNFKTLWEMQLSQNFWFLEICTKRWRRTSRSTHRLATAYRLTGSPAPKTQDHLSPYRSIKNVAIQGGDDRVCIYVLLFHFLWTKLEIIIIKSPILQNNWTCLWH